MEDAAGGQTAALVRELGGGGRRIPAMIRLEGDRIVEIRYAGPEGAGCDGLPPEGELEARGNEPFWHLRVDGTQALVRTPEEPDGRAYGEGEWSRPGEGRWLYRARQDSAGGGERLRLELVKARCMDSMSAAWYPFRAVLGRGDTRMEGCALEGRSMPTTREGG